MQFELIRDYNRNRLSQVKLPIDVTGFAYTPFQHQLDGVEAFIKSEGRMMLAWEMGSGKTAGSALIMESLKVGPTVLFSPASLMLQHKEEFSTLLTDRPVVIFKDRIEDDRASPFPLYIVSYARTKKFRQACKALPFNFELAILDESTFIKNHKALRTKDIEVMVSTIPLVLMLTGTPIINRPVDLFTQFRIANPLHPLFKDWWRFTRRFCNGRQGPFGYKADGLSHADELSGLASSIMHRVKKEDCLDSLG